MDIRIQTIRIQTIIMDIRIRAIIMAIRTTVTIRATARILASEDTIAMEWYTILEAAKI